MASAFDQERVYKIFSFFYGAVFLWLGFWILHGLVPVVFDPASRMALVDLPDPHIDMSSTIRIGLFTVMIAAGAASLGWGIFSITHASQRSTGRRNGIILALLAIAFVMLETSIRIGLERQLPFALFSNPAYLANPACGDVYYRLAKQPGDAFDAASSFDPVLGWTGKTGYTNPEGLRWPANIDSRPKAWFFGDSAFAGTGDGYQSVPAQFESRNPDRQSLNYGVPGYGLDQVWLRYQQEAPGIPPDSPVYIGILTTGLDRSMLEYSVAFKPVFQKGENGFVMMPPPSPDIAAQRLADGGELVDSYTLAILRSLAELVQTGFDRSEAPCQRAEKVELNRYLIGKILVEAEQRKHDLHWIVFTGPAAFIKPASWRSDFLTKTLQDHGQTFLDTRRALECAAMAAGTRPESYFIPNDGHLSPAGNAIVAAALVDLLADRPPACPATR